MPLWMILTLTSLAVVLVGLLVAGTVYFVRKYSSTRGDYYTQVSSQGGGLEGVRRRIVCVPKPLDLKTRFWI